MDIPDTVRSVLLDLGLEDLIPLPEAAAAPEVRALVKEQDLVEVISSALGELVREGAIRLFRGAWNSEPQPVSAEEGARLLHDSEWYRFRTDDPDEERLYFVNIDNLRQA